MTKAKPFVATPVPDLTGKGPDDTIRRAQIVALIASIVTTPNDDPRTIRHRISSKLTTDTKNEKLHWVKPGVYRLGDVSDWARQEWSRPFDMLPMKPRTATVMATESPDSASGSAYLLPMSLAEAHATIHSLHQRIATLEQSLAAAEDQLKRDAPDAKKWRDANFHRTKEHRDSLAKSPGGSHRGSRS